MSEVVGEAIVRIKQDESGYDPAGAGKRAGDGYKRGFTGSIKGLAVTIGGVLALSKGIDFLKDANAEARESQKVNAQTVATIKATGDAAGLAADQVSAMSGRLSNVTGIDDEVIQQGSNLLLTFKNVKDYVDGQFTGTFDRATAAAVDLSSAGFGSVSSASVMLGKALNDPIKGITALSRSGVTFSEAQKKQITALTEAGKLSEAQNLILTEVEGQVGGVAAATATAGEKASVAYGNIKESVGTLLIPVLDSLANVFVSTVAPAIQTGITALSGMGPVFQQVGDTVGRFVGPVFDALGGVVSRLAPLFQQFGSSVGGSTGPMDAISAALASILPVAQTAANTFQTLVLPAIQGFASYVITNVVPVVQQMATIFLTQVVPAIAQVATFVYGTLYPALIRIVTTVATNLKPVLDTLIDVFVTRILPAFQSLVQQVRTQLLPALEPLITKVVKVAGVLLGMASAILGKVLPPLIRLAAFILTKVIPVVVSIIAFVARFVNGLLNLAGAIGKAIGHLVEFQAMLVGKVHDAVASVVDVVAGLPGRIIALGGRMLSAGKSIIGKFVEGLKNAGGIVSGIAGNVWDVLKGLLNGAIDRINNALEFSISIGFGKHITINPPDIAHLQSGTFDAAAGFYNVGEVGPERVYIPEGARVLTAAQTRQANARDALAAAPASRGLTVEHLEVHNHYPLPEKPSTATQRLANLPFLLGA